MTRIEIVTQLVAAQIAGNRDKTAIWKDQVIFAGDLADWILQLNNEWYDLNTPKNTGRMPG